MATNHDLINSTDADITGWGGSAINVPKRTISANVVLTDAQAILGAVTASAAVMKANSTSAQRAQVAGAILDTLVPALDLSTPELREFNRLKLGLEEGLQIMRQICS